MASVILGYLYSCLIIFLYRHFGNFKCKFLKPIFISGIILFLFLPIPLKTGGCLPSESQKKQIFLDSCKYNCANNIGWYCFKSYNGDDWNSNGVRNEIVKLNNAGEYLYACEDRIYCFLTVPCKKLGNTSTEIIQNCAKLLCQNYLEKYNGNVEYANEAVLRHIRISTNLTECNFSEIPEENNWHKKFFPENVCEKYINKTAD